MTTGNRLLELPTAAVYLSEAMWRAGDAEAADAAADLALGVASARGGRHLLLQALDDVPAVAVRRADAEPSHSSPWHELVAALSSGRVALSAPASPRLVLEEFGVVRLCADGREVRPRLAKSTELLAFLLNRPGATARRALLLESLFPGRSDAAGRSYLRQAVYRLREVLPEGVALLQEDDVHRLTPHASAAGSSGTFGRLLAEAGRQDGEHRFNTLLEALRTAEGAPTSRASPPRGWTPAARNWRRRSPRRRSTPAPSPCAWAGSARPGSWRRRRWPAIRTASRPGGWRWRVPRRPGTTANSSSCTGATCGPWPISAYVRLRR